MEIPRGLQEGTDGEPGILGILVDSNYESPMHLKLVMISSLVPVELQRGRAYAVLDTRDFDRLLMGILDSKD